ncbi:MAG: aminopeptidase P family protein [Verrucomicrobiales bacterium]|nr:aminopeptidase P family protein [Verrucomicrobiales bacterium]
MKISEAEFTSRLHALRHSLNESGLDALLVNDEESIYYLTGLTFKSLERLFILIITSKQVTFILPKMELAHLNAARNVDRLCTYWEYPAKEGERWSDVLLRELGGAERVGVERKAPAELLFAIAPRSACILDLLECQRFVKSPAEIELIRQAVGYCDFVAQRINETCRYGTNELAVLGIGREVQGKIMKETEYDLLTTSALVFVWPGRISHQPHGIPSLLDTFTEGSHISLAFLRVNGYAAECERTFFTTEPTADQKRLFATMLEARRRSYAVLREGITAAEVDLAAKEFLIAEGHQEHLMHRTGHGIGLGNHEGPYIAEGDSTVLKENMVISIEPGIYIEGIGGFRHSDTVRITKDGYERLTHTVDDLESLTFKARPEAHA